MKSKHLLTIFFLLLSLSACDGTGSESNTISTDAMTPENQGAAIIAVTISGEPGNYTFSTTVESPDTGCNQYADWWEVLTPEGALVYRRILTHSHVNEQPFARSGGPVTVSANDQIIVRAHMNSIGYGERVFSGSVEQGLVQETINASFAEALEIVDPLPTGCAF